MGRTAAVEIDTPAKRRRLRARRNPYWLAISGGRGGVSLGYRKATTETGSWIAKIVISQCRVEERLGYADDSGPDGLGFRGAVENALAWSVRQVEAIDARGPGAKRKAPTVKSAIETYCEARVRRNVMAGANAVVRLRKHVLQDHEFAAMPLRSLRASVIQSWRVRMTKRALDAGRGLAPSSVNRLLNDLRAALNAAVEMHRRELPPFLPAEIRVGTKRLTCSSNARKQILTDEQVQALMAAAWTIDEGQDFGPVVLLAAVTGARFSQLAALKVGDLQIDRLRVLVPSSRKGRSSKPRATIPVPLAKSVVLRLAPAIAGRDASEPLLQRWGYRNAGGIRWTKDKRISWSAACETEKFWRATVATAGLAVGATMYGLRHTSIVRGLCAGLPIRLVAAAHDTSVAMIEAHYSAHILEVTEELQRKCVVEAA